MKYMYMYNFFMQTYVAYYVSKFQIIFLQMQWIIQSEVLHIPCNLTNFAVGNLWISVEKLQLPARPTVLIHDAAVKTNISLYGSVSARTFHRQQRNFCHTNGNNNRPLLTACTRS